MVQNCYNNVVKYLLPLYSFNYIISNDVIQFVGAYSYCPYIPLLDKLFILYRIIDKEKSERLDLPNTFKKEIVTISNETMLIVVLNKPDTFYYDWECLVNGEFDNISYECQKRILNSDINKYNKKLIYETFHSFTNRTIRQSSINKEYVGFNEMLTW
jgi:hypothetical protein